MVLVRRLALVLLSVGWVLPLWITGTTLITGLNPNNGIISFPVFEFASQAFTVTCVWLALAIAVWVWRVTPAGEA